MKSKLLYPLVMVGLLLFAYACERPSAPDFSLEQRSSIPLVKNITYEFLGGKGTIIDTTSSTFVELFDLDAEGTVRIVQELEFEIGDLDDAIPEIDIDPISIQSEIGDITIDDFSATFDSEIGTIELDSESSDPVNAQVGTFNAEFSGEGAASYEDVTGEDPATVPAGTLLPAGNSAPIIIELDAGDFEEAVIESGAIRVVFRNELGFDIAELNSTLISDGDEISVPSTEANINHNTTREISFPFDPGDVLRTPVQVRIQVSWNEQNTSSDAGDLLIQEAGDDNLVVSRAVSNIPAQVISPDTPDLEINNPNFVYAVAENSSTPNVNRIRISMTNQTNLPITNGTFNGLPQITLTNSNGDVLGETATFLIEGNPGATSIENGQTGTAEIDINGQTLTKVLSYTLDTGTPGGSRVEVNATDLLIVSSVTTDLEILEANSDVDPQSNIELTDTAEVEGDFVDAEVEQGFLSITFTNESAIPLVIDELVFTNEVAFRAKNTGRMFDAGSEVGRIENLAIPANSSATEVVDISGRGISNSMRYEGTASSPGTDVPVTVNRFDQIITNITGEVTLSSATAILESQDFSTSGTIEIDKNEFILSSTDHFVEIQSARLRFTSIINNIDMDLDTLIISFPDIRRPGGNFGVQDSLVIQFVGNERIRRRTANQTVSREMVLDGHRIYALDNQIRYHVFAKTENTADSDEPERTVNKTDFLEANVQIDDLVIGRAFGQVVTKAIRLNPEPSSGDSSLDLFNDEVAQITNIEDLEELSRRISNIQFFNPTLNLSYRTNIGVPAEMYAAILGINESGEEVYLSGINNSSFQVPSNEMPGPFFNRGSQIPAENLIRFRVRGHEDMNTTPPLRNIAFTSSETNVEAFLSNLPTSIRFVGEARVNPDETSGFIINPIEFTTNMGLEVPLNFSTGDEPGVSRDTVQIDLSTLPKPEDDVRIKNMRLVLTYENGLPLEFDLALNFLDENNNSITVSPLPGAQPYILSAAPVDPQTSFVTQSSSGSLIFTLEESQLNELHRTRNLGLDIRFRSSEGEPVKLRATDSISLGIVAEFTNVVRVD